MRRIIKLLYFTIPLLFAGMSFAQLAKDAHIGCAYPAGGRTGTTFEVFICGQNLKNVSAVYFSDEGVNAVVSRQITPLKKKEFNEFRQKLNKMQKSIQKKRAYNKKNPDAEKPINIPEMLKKFEVEDILREKFEVELKTIEELIAFRKKLFDPKKQLNPQLEEHLYLNVTIAPNAKPGKREFRLKTTFGLSNPLVFQVNRRKEISESEPNNRGTGNKLPELTAVTVNGCIMPGDIDRFSFKAHKGDSIVAAVSARDLIPYLADAVPGWFQAVLTLSDTNGNELSYVDDYTFHPDPVLHCQIPADGEYVLEIMDAIYRGREDFVYRIALGKIPFITSIFPLGGPAGKPSDITVRGWNLGGEKKIHNVKYQNTGSRTITIQSHGKLSNPVIFAIDNLPEKTEVEPNNTIKTAQTVKLPLILSGRIEKVGDCDVFRFNGMKGDKIIAEINARHLGSPLDSLLTLTDAHGTLLASNDDHEDKGAGLTAHHADSLFSATLPADGDYYVHLIDAQNKGGPARGYRLRISPPRPDFDLRVTPSTVNVIAGRSIPLTMYILRKDGFNGEITLSLEDAPDGFGLSGALIPAGTEKIRLTLDTPPRISEEPLNLKIFGAAEIGGRLARHKAVPADDTMQAFLYRHLVPVKDMMVCLKKRGKAHQSIGCDNDQPIKIPSGGTARITFSPIPKWIAKQAKVELDNPPDGITIQEKTLTPNGIAIQLSTNPEQVKAGAKGNLIITLFTEKTINNKRVKNKKRRNPLGCLPAVPFEITAN